MKTLFINPDLYQMLINFAEENWEAFKQRGTEGTGIPEEEFEEWFDKEK